MKINEFICEMLRLSHLLFFPRTWHLIDCPAFYANSFTLASLYVCLWEDVSKNGGFFWGHFKLWLGRLHPAGCVGWRLWVFQPAPHEVPSPAAGSSCHAAAHFLSDLPAYSPRLPWFASWGLISTFQLSATIWRWHVGPSEDDAFCLLPLSFLP